MGSCRLTERRLLHRAEGSPRGTIAAQGPLDAAEAGALGALLAALDAPAAKAAAADAAPACDAASAGGAGPSSPMPVTLPPSAHSA
jgi:hypothetical protein